MRALGIVALFLPVACGDQFRPNAPSVPTGLAGVQVTQMALVDSADVVGPTLCVERAGGDVSCAGLGRAGGEFLDVGLSNVSALVGLDDVPVGVGLDGGGPAICGASGAGLTCTFLDDTSHPIGGGPQPTQLDPLSHVQETAFGLALCGEWPGVGTGCLWDVAQLRSDYGTCPSSQGVQCPAPCLWSDVEHTVTCFPPPQLPDGGSFALIPLDMDAGQPAPGVRPALQLSYDASGTSCAVTVGGIVQCWGGETMMGLGASDGSPAIVMDSTTGQELINVVSVATAKSHACALLGDGTVSCWGQSGQFAAPGGFVSSTAVPVPNVQNAVAIVAGDLGIYSPEETNPDCALTADGEVICWGGNTGTGGSGVPEGT